MRQNITKTTLLALVATIFASLLPMLASNDSMSAEAQRRPTVRRRTPGTSTVIVPSGTNLRVGSTMTCRAKTRAWVTVSLRPSSIRPATKMRQ